MSSEVQRLLEAPSAEAASTICCKAPRSALKIGAHKCQIRDGAVLKILGQRTKFISKIYNLSLACMCYAAQVLAFQIRTKSEREKYLEAGITAGKL